MKRLDDKPAMRLRVEPNRLVPADGYSEELLDQYRIGTVLVVRETPEKGTYREKKEHRFWAILNLAIKTCPTPWRRSRQAADALKRALGVVDQGATLSGAPIVYPGSLNDLNDPEFDAFFEGAMAILSRITGVDVETLRKEAGVGASAGNNDLSDKTDEAYISDVDIRENAATDSIRPADAELDQGNQAARKEPDSGVDLEPQPEPVDGTATLGPVNADSPVDVSVEPSADSEGKPSGSAAVLQIEDERDCVRRFVEVARDPKTTIQEKIDIINEARGWWSEKLPTRVNFVKQVADTAERVAQGKLQGPSASAFLHSLVGGKM